jgi:hypothetical protein
MSGGSGVQGPRVILISGLPGNGKSTLATRLGQRIDAVTLSREPGSPAGQRPTARPGPWLHPVVRPLPAGSPGTGQPPAGKSGNRRACRRPGTRHRPPCCACRATTTRRPPRGPCRRSAKPRAGAYSSSSSAASGVAQLPACLLPVSGVLRTRVRVGGWGFGVSGRWSAQGSRGRRMTVSPSTTRVSVRAAP